MGLTVIVGGGHGLGEQAVPAPCQELGEAQDAWVVTEQVPDGAQQAPVGWGQGFGEHTVATPCQVLVPTQAAWVVTVHVPAIAQQAPTGTQGLGEQVAPAP